MCALQRAWQESVSFLVNIAPCAAGPPWLPDCEPEGSVYAAIFLDILLQLLECNVSRCVLSVVWSEIPKPLRTFLTITGWDSVREIHIEWRLPWWRLSVAGYGNLNRISKASRWLNTYLYLSKGVNTRTAWRRQDLQWKLKRCQIQISMPESKKSASYWHYRTWTKIWKRNLLVTTTPRRHGI